MSDPLFSKFGKERDQHRFKWERVGVEPVKEWSPAANLAVQLETIGVAQQLNDLRKAIESLIFNQGQFPWSGIRHDDLRTLIGTDPSFFASLRSDMHQAIANDPHVYVKQLSHLVEISRLDLDWRGTDSEEENDEQVLLAEQKIHSLLDMGEGFTKWVRGGRRLVSITPKSFKKLYDLPVDFTRLPSIPSGEEDWKRGYMFHFSDRGILVYLEPHTGILGNGVTAWAWQNTPIPRGLDKRLMISDVDWAPILHRRWMPRKGYDDDPSLTIDGPHNHHAWWFGSAPYDAVSFRNRKRTARIGTVNQERIEWDSIICTAINALCAILSVPDVVRLSKPKKNKRGRRKSSAGGVRGVQRMTLAEDATRLAVMRFMERDEVADRERERETRTVGIHHVAQHSWRVWVNNPLPHETILGKRTKQLKDGTIREQYRVKRLRGPAEGYTRGTRPMEPKRSVVVTGIDDG